MSKMLGLTISAVLAVVLSGCGKSAGPDRSSTPPAADQTKNIAATESGITSNGPAEAVHAFLEALRTGNDDKAAEMLSSVAREKSASLNRNVTPPASDTAKFIVGNVEYLGDDGARVACTWTDIDEEGREKSDKATWVLRREKDGWRVAGVAAELFSGEAPLLLDFEDPEAMFRKQQWVREEIRRRMDAEELQAQSGENSEKPALR